MESVKKVWQDPALFKEARYALIPSLPLDLGSISLGYSGGSAKIYLTKEVGQEGCIDWDIQSFISTWKNAIINREFTPELTSLFQGVTNEIMPGFAFDIGSFHWFLRPHVQNTNIGFALFGSRSVNILSNDANSLKNLQFLSANIGELIPASGFLFRRATHNLEIGDVSADIFVMVSSTSNIFIQICFKFLFRPETLTAHIINTISSNASATQQTTRLNRPTLSQSPDLAENTENDGDSVVDHINDKSDAKANKNTDYKTKAKPSIAKTELLYPTVWKWLQNNRFSLISISAAGLAINAATKAISRDLRVKL